jgi:hypothetical protein
MVRINYNYINEFHKKQAIADSFHMAATNTTTKTGGKPVKSSPARKTAQPALDPELISIVPLRKRLGRIMRATVKIWNRIAPVALAVVVWVALLSATVIAFAAGVTGWGVVFLILFILFTFISGIVFGWKLVS